MEYFDSGNRKNGFDRDWRFMPDLPPLCDDCHGNTDVYSVTRTGKRCRYAVSGFDDSGWRKVRLPHDWLVGQDFDTDGLNAQGFFRRGYAWYRKEFRLLSDCRGKQILLCFDGIAGKSEIYINGSLIKRNFSSYNTFTVDITDRVYHGDRTNTVAVFVDRRDVELWAYEGAGIHRHAWLYIKDAVHIAHDGLFVTSRPESGGRWKVTAGITAESSHYTDTGYDIAISVFDASGNIVGAADAHGIAPADGRSVVTSGFYVDSPALWDTDSPTLYTVSAELSYSGGKDREACVHGFRTFTADPDKGFFLNGKPIKFYGICCHQGHAGVGTAVPDSIVAFRMKKLKELGINGFRCVHHNPSPKLLDECDRLGILVIDENRNFESGEEYIGYIEDMVRRDRNHPSVVMYALFNEEPIAEFPEGGNIYRRLASAVKRLDGTRLLTGAMNEDSAFGEGGAEGILNACIYAKAAGIDCSQWEKALKKMGASLVRVQNSDGSFYRAYNVDGSVCTDTSSDAYQGRSKLNTPVAVRFLCNMYRFTGDVKYKNAAMKAADYCYNELYLGIGKYVGGTPDNPNVPDKEASVFALYAFSAIYDLTGDEKYARALEHAAVSAMSWVYTYDFPVTYSLTTEYDSLNIFKNGSTAGWSIIATGHSAIDVFGSNAYYELFRQYVRTGNSAYLTVSRLLENNLRSAMDLSGKRDYRYPGFSLEACNTADMIFYTAENGVWLPWISAAFIEPMLRLDDTFGQMSTLTLTKKYDSDTLRKMLNGN